MGNNLEDQREKIAGQETRGTRNRAKKALLLKEIKGEFPRSKNPEKERWEEGRRKK